METAHFGQYVEFDMNKNFLFNLLLRFSFVMPAILVIVSTLAWNVPLIPYFDLGPSCILVVFLMGLLSFRTQKANEYGICYFYGMPLRVLNAGPHYIPTGFMQFETLPRDIQEFQCPDEPENVFKGHDDQDAGGKSRPIRVTTGAPKLGKTNGGVLAVQSTIIVSFVFRWQLVSDALFRTIKVFGTSFSTVKSAVEKQLRDIGESVVAEMASERTTEQFIAALPEINRRLRKASMEHFKRTGIRILSALMISPDLGETTAGSLSTIPQARAEAQNRIVLAGANRQELIEAGKGKASARLAMLQAEAEGQKKIMEDLGIAGETVLSAQTAQSIVEKTDVLIAGAEGGMKDVLGLVKGAQSALKKGERK